MHWPARQQQTKVGVDGAGRGPNGCAAVLLQLPYGRFYTLYHDGSACLTITMYLCIAGMVQVLIMCFAAVSCHWRSANVMKFAPLHVTIPLCLL